MSTLWRFDILPVRIISILIPLGCIALGGFFSSPHIHWTFLLLVSLLLGYMHFAIATTYQIAGILRHKKSRLLLKWFFILSSIGVLVSVGMILAGHTLLLSLLSISYFVLHVLANEHTFLERAGVHMPPYWIMLSLVIPIGALYFISFTHPSLFFSYDLQYYDIPTAEQLSIIGSILPVSWLQPIAIVSVLAFLLTVPYVLWKRYQLGHYSLGFGLIGLITCGLVLTLEQTNFMYILHFVLVYHFLLLSLLFITPMKRIGEHAWRTYYVRHIYWLVPLTIAGVIFMYQLDTVTFVDYVFQFQLFVVLSITHITASILNEHWFKNWLLSE